MLHLLASWLETLVHLSKYNATKAGERWRTDGILTSSSCVAQPGVTVAVSPAIKPFIRRKTAASKWDRGRRKVTLFLNPSHHIARRAVSPHSGLSVSDIENDIFKKAIIINSKAFIIHVSVVLLKLLKIIHEIRGKLASQPFVMPVGPQEAECQSKWTFSKDDLGQTLQIIRALPYTWTGQICYVEMSRCENGIFSTTHPAQGFFLLQGIFLLLLFSAVTDI